MVQDIPNRRLVANTTQRMAAIPIEDLTAAPETTLRPFLVPVRRAERPVEVADEVEIGRAETCALSIDDVGVSFRHCRVFRRDGTTLVEDLGSTNGTFVDGQRISQVVPLPLGSSVRVARVEIRLELRAPEDVAREVEMRDELRSAARHIESLLPKPLDAGPVQACWRFIPSLQLGGDAFGYGPVGDDHFMVFLIDVCGHGVRAALHSVSILNALRQRTLPGADFLKPDSVLARLNEAFRMDDHGGMFFTLWYGVIDLTAQRLTYVSGGHPPALVVPPGGGPPARLQCSNPPAGAFDGATFVSAEVGFARGSRLYVYSDGVFEEPDHDGRPLGMAWLETLVGRAPGPLAGEPLRMESGVRDAAANARFEDDFSLVVLESS